MKEVSPSCEVCNSKKLINVLDLGMHPLCDDLIEIGSIENCKAFLTL